jgi:hypothetical protein
MSEMKVTELIVGDAEGQHIRLTGEGIFLFDSQRKERMSLQVYGDGTPWLSLNDGNGTERIKIYVAEDGFPFFEILDGARTVRISCLLDPDDSLPYLAFYGRANKPALEIGLDYDETPTLTVTEKKSDQRQVWLKATDKK